MKVDDQCFYGWKIIGAKYYKSGLFFLGISLGVFIAGRTVEKIRPE